MTRKLPAILIVIAMLVVAGVAAYLLYGGAFEKDGRGIASIGGPFTLTDQNGTPRTDADFRGEYMLIYFGYTYCPDVCPTALQVMSAALDRLEPAVAKRIRPVFITIDPERDTVDQLRSYASNFHPRLVGLTGTAEQIARAAKAYRVYYAKAKGTGTGNRDYLMDHSSIIFLMDPEGRYVTHFTHTAAPDKLADALRSRIAG